MKSMKKVFSLVLSFVLLLSLAMTAFAASGTTNKITITSDKKGHTYEAYQIFKGDLANGVLSNVEWGKGVTLTGAQTLKVTWGTPETTKTLDAAGWAEELNGAGYDSALAKAFADAVSKVLAGSATGVSTEGQSPYTITDIDAGYYLVKDQDESVSGQDAYTRFILKVVGEATASPKGDVPSVDKEVLDINDSTETEGTWGKTADHDIGDQVSFRLIGTLPSNYADYKSYKYIFHDKMSAGLTLDEDSITVKVVTGDDPYQEVESIQLVKGKDYNVKTSDICGECTFHVEFTNLKLIEGLAANHKIMVEYDATLNQNAVIGNPGNPNDVKLQFSNDPNYEKDGEPNEDDEDEPTGDTPWEEVVVFTFELDVDKVKDTVDGEALAGAGFTLYKEDASAPGTYKAIQFKLVQKDGTTVAYPATEEEIEAWNNAQGKPEELAALGYTISTELTAENLTTFKFIGLDDGNYKLSETTTPAKYNTIDDIEFTITAKHDETNGVTELTFKPKNGNAWTSDKDTGIGTTKIVNKTGSTLPETGGIGTTIFYVIGGILVVFAGVLLITKRRMKSRD